MANRFNFRTWDSLRQEFNYFGFDYKKGCKLPSGQAFLDKAEIMQSTGLEDKNGKEIFEGDIVKIVGTNEIFPVQYYDNFCCFGLKVKQDGIRGKYYSLDKKIAKDIEIIGNIYKNKELLEK